MSIQRGIIQFGGMNQDMNAKDPKRDIFYYEGQNITIVFNRELSQNIVSNERGNKLLATLPNVLLDTVNSKIYISDTDTTVNDAINNNATEYLYGTKFDDSWIIGTSHVILNQKILGGTYLKDRMFIISTDSDNDGHLLVWEISYEVDFTSQVELIYFGPNANMSDSSLITKIFGLYETASIQKIHWTDGRNQLRILNTSRTDLFNLPVKTIDSVPEWDYTQPKIIGGKRKGGKWLVGGTGGPGLVQYGYRLYTKHGAVTKVSPLSLQGAITEDDHGVPNGGEGNNTFNLEITVDTDFEYIEVYRFTHDNATSRNTQCHLIYEGLIESSTFKMEDQGDGNNISLIADITNLLTTPSGPYYPNTMEFKDNRIFLGGITSTNTDIDYDTRAYGFSSIGQAGIYDIEGNLEIVIDPPGTPYPTDEDLDAINESIYKMPGELGYNSNRYQEDGTTLGAEGPNVSVSYGVDTIATDHFKDGFKYNESGYKRGELYRFGIQFYDKVGTPLFVKWVADLKMPPLKNINSGDLYTGGSINNLFPQFTLNNLDTLPEEVYGFKIVRVPSEYENRYIKTQGLLNSTIYNSTGRGSSSYAKTFVPHGLLRHYKQDNVIEGGHVFKTPAVLTTSTNPTLNSEYASGVPSGLHNSFAILNYYCPEVLYAQTLIDIDDTDYVHTIGGALIDTDVYYKNAEDVDGGSDADIAKTKYNTLSAFEDIFDTDQPNSSNSWQDALLSNQAGLERFHWIMHQKTTEVDTELDTTTTELFHSLNEVKKVSDSSSLVTIADSDYRHYHFVVGGVTNDDNDKFSYRGRVRSAYLFDISSDWKTDLVTNHEIVSGGSTAHRNFILADIWNDTEEIIRYKGLGNVNRRNNNYIAASELQIIGSNTTVSNVRAYQGDVFPQMFKFLLMDYDEVFDSNGDLLNFDPEFYTHDSYDSLDDQYTKPGNTTSLGGVSGVQSGKTIVEIPVETYMNLQMMNKTWDFEDHKKPEPTLSEVPSTYDNSYHNQDTFLSGRLKPFTFTSDTEDGIITRYSDVNLPGSYINNHNTFQVLNQASVDARFGNITAFHIFKETLYVIQEYGTGYWSISPTAIASTSTGPTSLGKGDVLDDYVIVSEKYGSRYNFGSTVGEKGVYLLDMSRKKFLRITADDEPVSDMKGIHSLLLTLPKSIIDDPYAEGTTLRLGYDPLTYNVYISIMYTEEGGIIGGGDYITAPIGGGS